MQKDWKRNHLWKKIIGAEKVYFLIRLFSKKICTKIRQNSILASDRWSYILLDYNILKLMFI